MATGSSSSIGPDGPTHRNRPETAVGHHGRVSSSHEHPTAALDRVIRHPSDDPRLPVVRQQVHSLPGAGRILDKRERVLGHVRSDAAWLDEQGFVTTWVDTGGVAAQLIEPPGPIGPGLLVTLHGGGFVLCSACTLAGGSYTSRADQDPFAHVDDLPSYVQAYLGATAPTDPAALPLFADLRGLAPLLIQVGSDETLFDDAVALAERAAAAGVETRLEEWTAMFHTWHAYVGSLTGADEATAAYADWVARRTKG